MSLIEIKIGKFNGMWRVCQGNERNELEIKSVTKSLKCVYKKRVISEPNSLSDHNRRYYELKHRTKVSKYISFQI